METNTYNEDATNADTLVYDQEAPERKQTPVEIAGHALIDFIAVMKADEFAMTDRQEAMMIQLADNLEDVLVREEAARLTTPVLLEVTGNVEERELAARYAEAKARGALHHAKRNHRLRDTYEQVAECFRAAASDYRAGLHLPQVHVEGRVIPYNEDNETGIKHEAGLRAFFSDVHARNVKAGWWHDLQTGLPKKRNVGELFILFVTEIAEGYLAWRGNEADDKLTQYPGLGVEMADLGIRWADFCGALLAGTIIEPEPTARNPGDEIFRKIVDLAMDYDRRRKTPQAVGDPETAAFLPIQDVAEMTDVKLAFNAHRPDHKIENRLKDDGKRT